MKKSKKQILNFNDGDDIIDDYHNTSIKRS